MTTETLLSLPTELLCLIFTHCDSETLFLSVRYVCKRLYTMTETYNRLELDLDSDFRNVAKSIYHLLDPTKISWLTILHSARCSYPSSSLISFIDMNRFTQLRSLSFHSIRGTELERYVPRMKINPLDSLLIIVKESEYHEGWTLLSLAVVHLNPRKFFFSSVHPITNHDFLPIDCQLEHLTLDKCDNMGCAITLQQLPRLKTFHIIDFIMTNVHKTTLAFSDPSFHSSLISLTAVDETFYTKPFSTVALVPLLARIPALIHLKLVSKRRAFDRVFDGSYWEQLVQSNLHSLKTFEFFLSYEPKNKPDMIGIDFPINSFQTPFWLTEKRWIVNCAYIIADRPEIWFYTNAIRIKRYQTSVRCEISSKDNVWHFTKPLLEASHDITPTKVGKQIS